MPLEGQQRVVAAHAMPVVDDADELAATGFNLHADAGGAGVKGVLQQFLDDRCGTLDHFAGGDLVGDLVGKNSNAAHSLIVVRLRVCNSG